jgi:hypothetical protein
MLSSPATENISFRFATTLESQSFPQVPSSKLGDGIHPNAGVDEAVLTEISGQHCLRK